MTARTLGDVLRSTSDTLFPDKLGAAAVSVDSRDSDGDTPLHVVALRGDVEGAQMLLAAGADPNAIGDMSETPLHVACRAQNPVLVGLLLQAGARPDIRSEFDLTPREMTAQDEVLARLFKDA